MFKEILEIFKRHSALDEIGHDFVEMIQIAQEMFTEATKCMEDGQPDPAVADYLKQRDEKINELEQQIRRRLYTHLLVSGTADLSPALAFMSIVKDAERLGDFTKNIFNTLHRAKSIAPEPCHAQKIRMRKHIIKQFEHIQDVIISHDEDRAREIVALSRRDQAECDQYIWAMVEGRNDVIECNNPVACALLFRFFKRVLSHLVHIATSVYMPLDKLDVFDEPGV